MPAGNADAAVGIMDQAYFTGRRELLDFFNGLLGLNLSKIEQTASGAVACQLCDYIFPGSIPMQRVNWEAKSDYEYIQNYKLLQQAFAKNKVQRYVDVDKLIRAKYQDNLEFCQWLKAFYDQSGVYRPEYDAAGIRSKGKGGKTVGSFLGKTASNYNSKPVSTGTRRTTPAGGTKTSTNGSQPLSVRQSETNTKKSTMSRNNTDQVVADAALLKKNSELSNKVAELESSLVEVEKERDFYFQKLRDIEIMLQVHQEKGEEASNTTTLMDNVFKVLYATAEDPIVVTDEGEVFSASAAHDDDENALFDEE